jgi:uncharacterized protein
VNPEEVPDDRAPQAESGPPVVVPHRELSPEALRGVVEAFVLREGTDYGERESSFDSKINDVLLQLERAARPISCSIRRPRRSASCRARSGRCERRVRQNGLMRFFGEKFM